MTRLKFTLLGVGLAGLTIVVAWILPTPYARDLLAVLLAVIGAIYVGFALLDGRPREVAIEISVAVLTVMMALAGLWLSPYMLAAGYFLHGLWDIVHRPYLVRTRIVDWYPPFCLVYDWLVAAFIVIWWANQ